MTSDAPAVADVMVTRPPTFGRDTPVARVRQFFDDDHVHAALVVDGDRLLTVIVRDDLPGAEGVAADRGALEGRIVAPRADAETVRIAMLDEGIRRLAVVDDARRLLGLLCLKRSGRGFCSDDDVAARAADRQGCLDEARERAAGARRAQPCGPTS